MNEADIIAVLAIVATLAVAAIAAVWKMASQLRELDTEQAMHRHNLRNEVSVMMANSEERVTQRVVELERNMMILAAHRSWPVMRDGPPGDC